MKLKTLAVASLVIVSMLVYPVIAQSTTISIEDIQVGLGGSKTVPIYIYNVTDSDGVGTVQLDLLYNSSVVNVTSTDVSNSDLDLVVPNTGNPGVLVVAGSYFGVKPLPIGDVRVIDVTFTAVGSAGDESLLDITNTLLADYTPQANDIPHDVDDGYFTISEENPPIVTNASSDPLIIPDDTDGFPLWGENTTFSVNVTDETAISTVTINLSAIGGSPITNMSNIGNYSDGTLWCMFNYTTNASNGTAGWNGSAYVPYQLEVNATDIHGNSNTSVSIELMVMRNGDVNEEGSVNFVDVTYLANHWVDTSGYESIEDNVADVNGDSSVNFVDVTYLANHWVGTSGYEKLR